MMPEDQTPAPGAEDGAETMERAVCKMASAVAEVWIDLPSLMGRASREGHDVGQQLARQARAKFCGADDMLLELLDAALRPAAPAPDAPIAALEAENARLQEALRWYVVQVAGCRKLGSIGDPFRHALDADGGKRALAALAGTAP